MPSSTPVIFKRTLIAVAVLSISACSSMPQLPSVDLGGVGEGIAKAGKATASATRKTWNTTTYLLGFTDSKEGDAASPSDEQLLVDTGINANTDINQVLPLEDAPIINSDTQLTGVDNPVLVEQGTAGTLSLAAPADEVIAGNDSLASTVSGSQAVEDLIHEVAANETLWDIAKSTTGDANNWHVLADINNLTQNAAVFPGQELTIPADMVKPDYDAPLASAPSVIGQEAESAIDASEEQLADSSRLSIPDAENATTEQLALSESDTAKQMEDKAARLAAVSENATSFDLNMNETLWDFAKRTTGDALNWQAIADQNNFSEKQAVTVRPGQTIFVPQSLLPEEANLTAAAPADDAVIRIHDAAALATDAEDFAPAVAASLAAALPPVSQAKDQAVSATENLIPENSVLDETQPIRIVDATYKTDDSLTTPANAELGQEPALTVENENIPANVMVSGTYYPKAVYNNADFSSSLLMRVSPGTTLQVSRAMGTWFEVETEKGTGYVHQRDIK